MNLLKQKIMEKIKSEGPISFEAFMEMALYYPGLGYYTKDTAKIGRAGDFYTSPHLHPIFGAMLGRQMEELWNFMGNPGCFRIVEMGAGMGYLAKDMLDYLEGSRLKIQNLKKQNDFFSHIQYTIVELNASFKAKQQELLGNYSDKTSWVSDLHELERFSGCFLSNELLDAFPVRVVEMDKDLKEIHVSASGDDFMEIKMPCSTGAEGYLKEFSAKLPDNYRTEVNLKIKDWLETVGDKLSEGFILTDDYGYSARDYYSDDRNRGTLLCYHRHQISEDPYQNVGEQDLTAHVNFSSLKKWGEDIGLETVGFGSQGTYLVSLGIADVITEFYGEEPDPFETAKIKGLILPQGMGESHQVMVQYKGKGDITLRGFNLRNHAGRL